MEDYKALCKELVEDHVSDTLNYDKDKEPLKILRDLLDDTQDVFGNLSGSRTYSTYEAQQFIDKSGAIWDEDIHELFEDIGEDYFTDTLKRGAETLDVVILELISHEVINDMIREL